MIKYNLNGNVKSSGCQCPEIFQCPVGRCEPTSFHWHEIKTIRIDISQLLEMWHRVFMAYK